MPKISIIVPVYKTENYIDKCIENLIQQTYKDFEVLLIDDGSPDQCGKICEEYALKDNRLKVFHHQKNQGVSVARNTGMLHACGTWIMFVDSDDWLDKEALQRLTEYMTEDTDLIVFGMVQEFENVNGQVKHRKIISPGALEANTPMGIGHAVAYLEQKRCFQYSCNKVYQTFFLAESQAKFQDMDMMEDFVFNVSIWPYLKKISIIAYAPYHYRRSEISTSLALKYHSEFFRLSKMRYKDEMRLLKSFNIETVEDLYEIQYVFLKHLVSTIARNCASNAPLNQKEKYIATKIVLNDREVCEFLAHFKAQGIKNKIICYVLRIRLTPFTLLLGKLAGKILIKG